MSLHYREVSRLNANSHPEALIKIPLVTRWAFAIVCGLVALSAGSRAQIAPDRAVLHDVGKLQQHQ